MMARRIALTCLLLLSGCATNKTRLISASPMPSESLGLYLEAGPRKGKMGAPYTILCNVCLHNLNNTSIPIWKFPRVTFYAEQAGEFYALRVIEEHGGGISAPYSMSGLSVTLPRPPHSGKWNIFAVQQQSDTVYRNHLRDHAAKCPLIYVEDQDHSHKGMWTEPLVSNTITVEFASIGPTDMKSAESVVQHLIEAGQFKADFRQPKDDPTKGSSVRLFRWRSKATIHPDAQVDSEQLVRWVEALDKPIGDLLVRTERNRDLEVDYDSKGTSQDLPKTLTWEQSRSRAADYKSKAGIYLHFENWDKIRVYGEPVTSGKLITVESEEITNLDATLDSFGGSKELAVVEVSRLFHNHYSGEDADHELEKLEQKIKAYGFGKVVFLSETAIGLGILKE